jgi:8-oxo-dGTP diphosphatase
MSVHELHSAGGVVLRVGAAGLDVLLVHMTDPDQWRLPKGKLRREEPAAVAAVREIREESGVLAEILSPLGETEHSFTQDAHRYRKGVTWFLLRPVSPMTALADPDFDQVAWMPIDEAFARLTFENERSMVSRAMDLCGASR